MVFQIIAQSSQTERTQEGSSFESASSLYSTRDGLSEDIPPTSEEQMHEQFLLPKQEDIMISSATTAVQISNMKSPSHSIGSTSSGSLNVKNKEHHDSTKPDTKLIENRSDEDLKENGLDSVQSATTQRRTRLEEERRRRRNNMNLNIEKENMRALASPIKKQSPPKVSPQRPPDTIVDPVTSPSKIKRTRPKIRRQFRKCSKDGGGLIKSPDRPFHYKALSPQADEQLLKAKSIESFRSVSPGSDSVFYSEVDGGIVDQQVHCLHCGKEVDIVTAPSDSHEAIPQLESDEHDEHIVKPPADFADSPITTKTSHRLYKKMDRKFRYEDHRSRHFRIRKDNVRAKSEERGGGKDRETSDGSFSKLRASDSSPCVLPADAEEEESDHIIYPGHYCETRYARLTDEDVWVQLDHHSFGKFSMCFWMLMEILVYFIERHRNRRGSTESEKAFHSKFQVILHRLVQRRCTLEMYHRQKSNVFSKFNFRILLFSVSFSRRREFIVSDSICYSMIFIGCIS